MVTSIPDGYKIVFDSSPAALVIVAADAPFYTIIDVNDAYMVSTNCTREEIIGQPIFGAFPDNPDEEEPNNVAISRASFDEALASKKAHTISNYRYDIPVRGTNRFEERYWTTTNTPVFDYNGDVKYIIHSPADVTTLYKLAQRERESIEKIKMAEERARLAIDAAGLGTFDINLQTGELITSALFARMFGFEKPVTREEYATALHPADEETREAAHKRAGETGTLFYESRIIWPDKSIRWIRTEGKVYYDTHAEPLRVLGTLMDITEQKLAREEQRKLITLVANSVDLMSILNMDGTNSYINDAGKKLLGFETDEEILTTPIANLHTPEDFEFVQREVLPKVITQGRWDGVMNVRHLQTGEVFQVANNCIRIDDPSTGEPIAVGAVMRDLRPELAAKKAIADSEQLLRNITTAAPTGLWMSDAGGIVTYVNQTWLDWTGKSTIGNGWLDAIINDDKEFVSQKYNGAIAKKCVYEAEFRIHHVDGTVHWCFANGKPQYSGDGTFTGYIGACVDITEQKQLQQQKDNFIGIASHELKTPVTSIKAYTQVLERMLMQKGDTREASMIAKMDSQLNRLTSLIGDLLDVTKINTGKLQFNDADFDFNAFVKELVEDLQRTTDKHTLIEDLKPTGIVYGDRDRISQVITNLIGNAIKYSPNASKILISTSIQDDSVKLCVKDYGIGIAKDNLDKVFEQFYRVSGHIQHTFPGLGLGLYISSEIIKREGGRIWVTSVEGEGSTFCFSLPLKK